MAKNNKQKQFAVLGLGRFGTSVALTLHELGYQVLGVDSDEEIVQDLSHELTHVVSADASDENTLRSLGINNYEVVIVGIGPLEDNLLTTLNLKEMGVPYTAKCLKKSAPIKLFTLNAIWASVLPITLFPAALLTTLK